MNGKIGVDLKQWQGDTISNVVIVSKRARNILYIEDNLANLRIVKGMLNYFEQ